MTLRESLIEHYITHPEGMEYVGVNGALTEDWDQQLGTGDVVEVGWPHVGIRQWTIGEPA